MTNKAYIKITNKNDRNILKEIIEESFADCNIVWHNEIATLETLNHENFYMQLSKIHSMAILDFNLEVSFFIVPFFDDIFLRYLDKLHNEVASAFEIFIKYIKEPETSIDALNLLKKISNNDLDTLKAFLKCNGNILLASSELYVHRNTFNYRLNHLIDSLNVDIRDLNTLMFLNLIINICA